MLLLDLTKMGKHQSNKKMTINLGKILSNNTLLEVGYEQTHVKKIFTST